jgi:hypothetical protein
VGTIHESERTGTPSPRSHCRAAWLLAAALGALTSAACGQEPNGSAALTVTYFIGPGEAESRFREADRELASWAIGAWERAAGGALSFVPGTEEEAVLRVYWVPAAAGQYGEMRPVLVNGQPGAAVYIRPDTDSLGPEIGGRARTDELFRDTVVYLTCLHEIGHALGLAHTAEFDDVMYSFGFGGDIPAFFGRYREQLATRADIEKVSGLSPGDVARLRSLYR